MISSSPSAHFTLPDGKTVPIDEILSIGRASGNQLVLPHDSISRHHALIHTQGEGEHWLVDLGSSNGTSVNERPLIQPARLQNGDRIALGDLALTFHCQNTPTDATVAGSTHVNVRTTRHWLLLADLEGFTALSQKLPAEELARTVGAWISATRDILEKHSGTVFKYLGDAIFAGWRALPDAPPRVAACLEDISRLQDASTPTFRVVLHVGDVTSSGSPASAELGMLGADVNFLFRMEKLAAMLAMPCLCSAAVAEALATRRAFHSVGRHAIKDFPGKHEFMI